MPSSPATVALICRSSMNSSEFLSQSELTAWLARMLFHWSDCDPPMCFSVPFRSSGSFATTVLALLSPTASFFALITRSSCSNAHPDQRRDGFGLAARIPGRPGARMLPGMSDAFDAEGHRRIMAMITATAAEAAPRRRAHGVAVQPFSNATGEGASLGLGTRQPAVEFGDAGPLLEEHLPVLNRPAVTARPEQRYDASLVTRQGVEQSGRRRHGRRQRQIVAVEPKFNPGGASRLQGFDRAQSRALQPPIPVFSGAEWGGRFASAPSAAFLVLDFNELARTVGTGPSPLPSASLATVRRDAAAKPLTGLNSGMGADDADGADGCVPAYSGSAWFGVVVICRASSR